MKAIPSFRKLSLIAATASAVFGVLVANSHSAGSQDANLLVGATVTSSCTISTTPVSFGAYEAVGANASTDVTATGTVVTTCTLDSSPVISLSNGANYDSAVGRRMKRSDAGGGDSSYAADSFLAYDLYTTAARTTRWDATGVAATTPTGAAVSDTVFAKLPGGQNVGVGTYVDTVVATVTF